MEETKDFTKKEIDPKMPEKKMRRNEPCYCGSGKKYKHCCGAL
jgi:preprotein translocase subunit SecA